MTNPDDAIANVMFDVSPSLRVNVWLTGQGDTERLAGVMGAVRGWLQKDTKARELLIEHPKAVATANAGPPKCPVHGTAMKASTTKAGGWYCTKKVGDGYCDQKAAA